MNLKNPQNTFGLLLILFTLIALATIQDINVFSSIQETLLNETTPSCVRDVCCHASWAKPKSDDWNPSINCKDVFCPMGFENWEPIKIKWIPTECEVTKWTSNNINYSANGYCGAVSSNFCGDGYCALGGNNEIIYANNTNYIAENPGNCPEDCGNIQCCNNITETCWDNSIITTSTCNNYIKTKTGNSCPIEPTNDTVVEPPTEEQVEPKPIESNEQIDHGTLTSTTKPTFTIIEGLDSAIIAVVGVVGILIFIQYYRRMK